MVRGVELRKLLSHSHEIKIETIDQYIPFQTWLMWERAPHSHVLTTHKKVTASSYILGSISDQEQPERPAKTTSLP